MNELQEGQRIGTVTTGGQLTVREKLGAGGQGIVYKADYNGREYALKWYFANQLKDPDKFHDNLNIIISNGAPTGNFLWPVELTERFENSFGYLMPIRPGEYKEFSTFLVAKAKFAGIGAVINAALQIVNSFRELHRKGYSYQDLNDGNFFINPATGDVLICDNDNVAPYGENMGIAGKCRYMAPEVVLGKKRPDIHTDRFSLAVILYLLLFFDHPLEGKATMCNPRLPCFHEEPERKFFGSDPVFVWDEANDTNRPVRGVHVNELKLWPLYPEYVRKTFQKAFSREAMIGADSVHRVLETEWQKLFITLRGLTVTCSCGNETFVDHAAPVSKCINCGNNIAKPLILKVENYYVAMMPGSKLYTCHMTPDTDDYKGVAGEVVASRNNPGVVGLRNCSKAAWNATLPGGSSKMFNDGEVIRLCKGMIIDFGTGNTAEIG